LLVTSEGKTLTFEEECQEELRVNHSHRDPRDVLLEGLNELMATHVEAYPDPRVVEFASQKIRYAVSRLVTG
jgi:hypothetical protein